MMRGAGKDGTDLFNEVRHDNNNTTTFVHSTHTHTHTSDVMFVC
jgi:hypothetical protein